MQYPAEAADFTSKPKSRNGVENKGLWSLSKVYTSDGGHLFNIASCCSGFTTLSCNVLMTTRGTLSTSGSSMNRADCIARIGPGLKSMEANVESWISTHEKEMNK